MDMAKKYDDDPDRVRPPQRGNDERRIGQEKKSSQNMQFKTKASEIHFLDLRISTRVPGVPKN